MTDSLLQDSVKLAKQVIVDPTDSHSSLNYWMWFAILEFVVILFFVFKNRLKGQETAKSKFKSDSLKQSIDFDNVINSSFNSIQLYDQLKVKCHPDRFPTDKDMNAIADSLFQEITKNRTNVKRLIELKEEAKQKLNIHF